MADIIIKITNTDGTRLLTPSEAGERLNLTPHQVRWLIRNDRIDGVVEAGGAFYIPETSLESIRYKPAGRPRGAKDSKSRKSIGKSPTKKPSRAKHRTK